MKILLVHPMVRLQDRPRHIPYGISMIAAVLQDKHEVGLCDMNIYRNHTTDTEQIYNYLDKCIQAEKWDLVGVGGLSSQYKDLKRILQRIRYHRPNTRIVVGGGFVTYLPKEMMTLNPSIDVACIGESEETIQELAGDVPLSQIKGIWYREGGELISTLPRPLIRDIDILPYPAYNLIDMDEYFKNSSSNESLESFQAKRRTDGIWERGCPRQCTFCSHNGMSRWDQVIQMGKEKVRDIDKEYGFQSPARWNSPKYIVEQTWHLYNKFGVDFITNMDENLCSNRKRVFGLCDMLISEGLHRLVKWGSLGDTASVDDEMIAKMKEAGCTYISYGGESASDRVLLKDIGKGVTRAHAQNAVNCMKRNQMRPIFTFMLGNAHEGIDDICETVDFFIINHIKCFPFICTPYPGSKIFIDHNTQILNQYDPTITDLSPPEKKLLALEKFLIELDDATEITAHISAEFNAVELLGLQNLMGNNDARRILRFAHDTGRPHDNKWRKYCETCQNGSNLLQNITN